MIKNFKYMILPAMLLTVMSCKKELDINTDPNNPTEMSSSRLLTSAEQSLGESLAITSGLSQTLSVYTHQLVVREEEDGYKASGSTFAIQEAWNGMYIKTLSNLDAIIKQGTANSETKYVGIAQILKAYTYSQLVDVFGDVPFSESHNLKVGTFYPKFDKGSDIYPALFTLLDQAITNLNSSTVNPAVPGTDDVIYKGSVSKWIKAANTIKLKLLLQQRRVKNVATEVNALLTAGNLISTTDESFLLPYGPNGATDDRNPGFGDYYASQRSNYISPWFYEILKGYNTDINNGIVDPRLPYYFYNQLRPTSAGTQRTEYRDGAFVSIYFSANGPDGDANQQDNMTLLGMYPVGGKYDDGTGITGGKITAASGTGAAPYRFITYADRLFMEAELIKEGVVTGDARAKFKAAMTEAFKQVDYVVTTFVKPTQTVPAIYNTGATSPMNTYIDAVLAQYDANTAKQLQYIITQKWISTFGSAIDAYTDYRRTGFPKLFAPFAGGFVQPPLNGDPTMSPQDAIQMVNPLNYPLTLPWYQSELESNINAPKQKTDPSTYKPFWLP
ncbi:SusD/RagB family nutrient-binding outer membrane lipoprotein [Pedobacter xixiisoli]|uniref:Susd and RagB outer membrane lipoprotein n=1 Tax=Pedobacter xixiisoli TaxID=1476464 RepID=A0A286ADS7_9SPHI|nr:SusD/RagB family nutrient-binding outer membrane lipoprotein [Pedobacter xixiisoli]SOD20044.1 Susd and RagB outer membrane lipoprotein [Pedobacter xixiisoli]